MTQASQKIMQQYIDGGVIPAQLEGQAAVSKGYVDGQLALRDANINAAMGAAGAAQADIDAHEASTTAHPAQNITYFGKVTGAIDVKQAIDAVKTTLDQAMISGDSGPEALAARYSTPQNKTYPSLKDRLDASDVQLEDLAYNAKSNGLKGDGTTGDYDALQSLLTKIGVNEAQIYFGKGTYIIGSNIVIPDNIKLIFGNGAKIKPNSNISVEINGLIEAGEYQIFDLSNNGSLIKNVYLKNSLNPQWWGAKGDNATNDSLAFQRMIDCVPKNSEPEYVDVYIPKGKYTLSATWDVSQRHVVIHGCGWDVSQLVFTSATHGIYSVNPTGNHDNYPWTLAVQDIAIMTRNTNTSASINGIHFSTTDTIGGDPGDSLRVENCLFRGQNLFSQLWSGNCIYANNANGCLIESCTFRGLANRTYGKGMYFDGHSTECTVTNCRIAYFNDGVLQYSNLPSGAEGLIVANCYITSVKNGVLKNHINQSVSEPQLQVIGNHINATDCCIKATNTHEITISDNLLYVQSTALQPVGSTPSGIQLETNLTSKPFSAVVHHNIIALMAKPADYSGVSRGLSINMSYVVARGNIFKDWAGSNARGIFVAGGCSNVHIGRDNLFNNCNPIGAYGSVLNESYNDPSNTTDNAFKTLPQYGL